jgi:glycosyltransferase involved in cell wall biosynthesis
METDTLLVGVLTKNTKDHIKGGCENIIKYINAKDQNGNKLFKNHKILFVDGNSTDGTYELALEFCNQDKNNREIIKQLNFYLCRPLALQQARNDYMEYFEPYFGKGVFLLLIDLDEVNSGPIDISGFESCFTKYSNFDLMGANQSEFYYDNWTYRGPDFNYDCWYEYRRTGDYSYVSKMQRHIPKDSPLIEVDSCFGGCAVYNTEKLKGIRYNTWREPDLIEHCDHISVNFELKRRGGKLYINPNFINI